MAVTLTEEQQAAAELLKQSRICLLTGGPGTGKTTTLAYVAKSFNLARTVFCAPTGRAAQRITEAMNESGITGISGVASTIHTLLKPCRNGHDKKGWGFYYNRLIRLPVQTIIGDEWSMVDNQTFLALLEAVPDYGKLILIGDPDQLPPVGVGAGLRDMISSGVIPHAKLTQVHRYAGRIAHVCQAINRGDKWMPSPALNDAPDAGPFGPENLRHVEHRNPEDSVKAMKEIIDALVNRRKFDPLNDVQVLCSRNDQGGMSRKTLNVQLQEMLNPKGTSVEGAPYRVGDKVMCLQNGIRESWSASGEEAFGQVYVANGEQGVVRAVSKKDVLVKFGNSHIKFTRNNWESQLTLAYAITVHKAQGGGWPAVLYMVDEARHVDRSLIYTAISRAKKLCFTIGRKYTLDQQCQRVSMDQRKTFLAEGVRDGVELAEI